MAWSLPFTSSASSILEVKDRQTLKEVQSYHKSSHRGHTLSQSPEEQDYRFQESEITKA
ncbi:mCG1045678 [Mus musculus]|uniref:RIKEN cDNA 4930455H04 gene n=1 Tax=Mus musculus TaxID=10090 RepID=D3Z622_MOUSE|nr:mCG1045678 [Mus musculus]